jgi:hypothetical protein
LQRLFGLKEARLGSDSDLTDIARRPAAANTLWCPGDPDPKPGQLPRVTGRVQARLSAYTVFASELEPAVTLSASLRVVQVWDICENT